jgi:hypothetical protein
MWIPQPTYLLFVLQVSSQPVQLHGEFAVVITLSSSIVVVVSGRRLRHSRRFSPSRRMRSPIDAVVAAVGGAVVGGAVRVGSRRRCRSLTLLEAEFSACHARQRTAVINKCVMVRHLGLSAHFDDWWVSKGNDKQELNSLETSCDNLVVRHYLCSSVTQ